MKAIKDVKQLQKRFDNFKEAAEASLPKFDYGEIDLRDESTLATQKENSETAKELDKLARDLRSLASELSGGFDMAVANKKDEVAKFVTNNPELLAKMAALMNGSVVESREPVNEPEFEDHDSEM